jgi:hypothetical protein
MFGYVDEAAILEILPSLEANCQSLSSSCKKPSTGALWRGKITFAPDKYELIHFSRRRADQDPSHTPSVVQ